MINNNTRFLGVDSTKVNLTEKKDALNNAITEYYTLEDFKPAYINYFDFSSASVTDIVTEDTWVKLNTNTTSLFSRDGLVHTNNRVTNTGGKKVFKIEGIISVASGNNNEIHTAFFKNGVLHPCSEQSTVTNSGNKVNALPFHCLIELNTNDFIEVYVKNKLNTTDITLGNVNVIVTEL
jgi:hypothetical protein